MMAVGMYTPTYRGQQAVPYLCSVPSIYVIHRPTYSPAQELLHDSEGRKGLRVLETWVSKPERLFLSGDGCSICPMTSKLWWFALALCLTNRFRDMEQVCTPADASVEQVSELGFMVHISTIE